MLLRAPSGTGKLMNALVVYDSAYGNTEKVARAIGSALGSGTKVLRASEVSSADLEDIDILVIGSPTEGGGRCRVCNSSWKGCQIRMRRR